MFFPASDDATICNMLRYASYGVYFTDSKRLRIKHNEIKNSLGGAVYLSSNCDSIRITTLSRVMVLGSGRSLRVLKEDTILLTILLTPKDYSGIVYRALNNKIIQKIIKGNGKYGIQILTMQLKPLTIN
ncbi:MAG: hypothetical protein CM15mP42_10770 [Methanobacteriota archaeon]|nr:MAG: hypothetical protein CM15mP42_10770 [Euryarchaeota archaeon]